MRKTVLTLMLAASAITSAASAQTAPATPRPPVRQDENRDGVTTRAEAIAQADARFAQMDTDRDGRVSAGEMRAYRTAMHDRMVASGRDVPVPPPGGRKHDGMGRRMDRTATRSSGSTGWTPITTARSTRPSAPTPPRCATSTGANAATARPRPRLHPLNNVKEGKHRASVLPLDSRHARHCPDGRYAAPAARR
jgi:hypothetical protein